ncbi:MAG: phytoene desaturase family protein [Ilumatobacteraceae bacterium]
MRVAVVGGGVGGLCVAIRLASVGHRVVLFEQRPVVGGKLTQHVEDGYTFDLGPTLLTMPHLFDEVFRAASTSLVDEVDIVRLDPQIVHRWPDGSRLVVPDPWSDAGCAEPSRTALAIEAFSPGEGRHWSAFARRAATIWEVAERTFMAGAVPSVRALARRGRSPLDLFRIDGLRTLDRSARRTFDDRRLQQVVGRYATYSGSSPFRAPATLACIAHVEQAFGCWHVVGGLGRLAAALERAASTAGVDLRTGADVSRITMAAGRVTGVESAAGRIEPAAGVISGVATAHLFADLLTDVPVPRLVSRAGRSTSVFSVCAAVRGRTEGIAHHQVFHSPDHRREFRDLSAGRIPSEPSIHASVASVTDRSTAPDGCENWVITVNVPAGVGIERAIGTAMVLNRLAERGVDLRSRIEFTRTLVPADIDVRYRAPGGSVYGTSSNGRRAAFARPGNIGPVDGLYLVGGSAHPGGGLPLVATSARIVADLIAERER